MKNLYTVFFLFLLCTQVVKAHNPLSAMYYLEVNNDLGILNVSLSQTGFQEALNKTHPNVDFTIITEVAYKQLAVDYIKSNFLLEVNGKRIELLKGGLKLGNHQTDLKFVTSSLPATFKSLEVSIDAFKENIDHQTIFSIALNGATDKLILSNKNDYSATVDVVDNTLLVKTKKFNLNYIWFAAIIPVFYIGKIVFSKGQKNK